VIEYEIPAAQMDALLVRFKGLSAKVKNEIAFAAVYEAVQPMIEAVRDNAPVNVNPANARESARAGSLKASIGLVMRRYKNGVLAVIGPVRGRGHGGAEPANYAHLVEYGHRVAHAKTGKLKRRASRDLADGDVQARPFMRPAFEATKGIVSARLEKILGVKIQGVIAAKAGQRAFQREAAAAEQAARTATTIEGALVFDKAS
jgi:hypothetical protein